MTLQWQDHIEGKPGALPGKPVFKSTRLTVEDVRNALGTGVSEHDLFNGYSPLWHDPLRAAMLYAAAAVRMDV